VNCLPWPKTCLHPACSVRRGRMVLPLHCTVLLACSSFSMQTNALCGWHPLPLPLSPASPCEVSPLTNPTHTHTEGLSVYLASPGPVRPAVVRMRQPTMLRMWHCVLTTCLESYTCTAELFDNSACCVVPPFPTLRPSRCVWTTRSSSACSGPPRRCCASTTRC
jgi:hypothetical protein